MYTVWMTNFNMSKGSFPNLEQAVAHAKALGFECHITLTEKGKNPLHICDVRPY